MLSNAPAPPGDMPEEEAEKLRATAADVVGRLRGATGTKEMDALDSITLVGIQAQRHAGSDLELLRVRIGDMVYRDGEDAAGRISKDLTNLRIVLNQIDPGKMRQESVVHNLVRFLPVGRNQLLGALERIAVRYEPVAKQVAELETRLREGRLLLSRDNIELRKLYEQAEAQQVVIQKNCYLGELLMVELQNLLDETDDAAKRVRIEAALFDVSTRVQDLRTMDEVDRQLFLSIEMTRQNNNRLGQAVDRSLTLVSNVALIGLAIQSALVRQARVLEANERTREFLGDLLVANSSAIRRHTLEIGDVYNSPVIAVERITRAHNELLEAISIAERLRVEGIASARDNILKLTQLAGQLDERAVGAGDQGGTKSLEA
jgi:uncharacterized protein YaaN involved in tellurite resistance